jgi:hypothetical protein
LLAALDGDLGLWLEDDRRLKTAIVGKAHRLPHLSIFGFHLIYWPGVQCPGGAAGNTNRLFPLSPSVQAEIAHLYLGVLFRSKLRSLIRTGFKTQPATILSQTCFTIHHHYAILFPFAYGTDRTSRYTGWLSTVITGGGQEGNKRLRVFTPLDSDNPPPTGWTRWHIVPILASYYAGITADTSGLVKVKG